VRGEWREGGRTVGTDSAAHEQAEAAGIGTSRLVPPGSHLEVRRLGLGPYADAWAAMKAFTAARTADTPDELWLLEHPPVYTYGVAGREAHLPRTDPGVPVVKVDRGGQVTWHGPGQIVLYTLLDLRRRGMGVRELVRLLEQAVLDLLGEFDVCAQRREGAPGVYVGEAKVAALGLRVTRGCSYHGLSLNVDNDLAPFTAIDPCGYPGLPVTRTADLGIAASREQLGRRLVDLVTAALQPAERSAASPRPTSESTP
jgi:lipoyl(octanoyl) transferase